MSGGFTFEMMDEAGLLVQPAHGHAHSGSHGHGHGGSPDQEPLGSGPSVYRFRPAPSEGPERELPRGAGRGKTLYLDAPTGAAGDMILAALFDLGVPVQEVRQVIASLGIGPVTLEVTSGLAGSLGAQHVEVLFPAEQMQRTYAQIRELLQQASLSSPVRELSLAIFHRLALAEAEVHRVPPDEVAFHEVGAVDSIVDIVGAAVCFDYLGARVVGSPLPLARGEVRCAHGVLPLPAPATLLCLRGVPTEPSALPGELVTPTGAAIWATVCERYSGWPGGAPELIGWGAGTRGLPDRPNALRAVLLEVPSSPSLTQVALLEANLDDLSPEVLAYAAERLGEAGALDVWWTPIGMKKGRPAVVLSCLARPESANELARVIFAETTTLGVRQSLLSRYELDREVHTMETEWGPVRYKRSASGATIKPEFEDAARIAREFALPLRQVIADLSQRIASGPVKSEDA
jgi:pyridinium-3,5-bisthiocarboxylic acid mononucleotide nickel chelatase